MPPNFDGQGKWPGLKLLPNRPLLPGMRLKRCSIKLGANPGCKIGHFYPPAIPFDPQMIARNNRVIQNQVVTAQAPGC